MAHNILHGTSCHWYRTVHCIVGSLDHQSKRSQLSYKTLIRLFTRRELPLATQLFYLQARYKLPIPGYLAIWHAFLPAAPIKF